MFCLAIREDRTRGGRSTYQCSYTLPVSLLAHPDLRSSNTDLRQTDQHGGFMVKLEPSDHPGGSHSQSSLSSKRMSNSPSIRHDIPPLLQVTNLFQYCCILNVIKS